MYTVLGFVYYNGLFRDYISVTVFYVIKLCFLSLRVDNLEKIFQGLWILSDKRAAFCSVFADSRNSRNNDEKLVFNNLRTAGSKKFKFVRI